jgi:hypothetical protein
MPNPLLLTTSLEEAESKLTPREFEFLKALRAGSSESSEDAPLLERSIAAKLAQQEVAIRVDKSKFTQRHEPPNPPERLDALDSIPSSGPRTKADLRTGDRAMHRGINTIFIVAGFGPGNIVKLHYHGRILCVPREMLARMLPTRKRMTSEERERHGTRRGDRDDS